MKIIIFFLYITLHCSCLFAQSGISVEDVKVFIGADQQIPELKKVNFKDEPTSLIKWNELEEKDFLDFNKWKIERKLKDQNPLWKHNLQETRLSEKVGYIIDCVGECRNYRGLGYARVRYLSTIMEGDEVFTMKDSYLWIYLLDGTLVRMSPESSINFKEINRGIAGNMIHARLNMGNILWWSRIANKFNAKKFKETDTLFLPLSMYSANSEEDNYEVKENDLFAYLEADVKFEKKYSRLNKLIEKSNKVGGFSTHSFLTFPNGSVFGKNVVAEFIILNGGKSYIKSRSKLKQNITGKWNKDELFFFYRGYNNKNEFLIEEDQWYRVGRKGRSIEVEENSRRFNMGEFMTANVPSILTARELLYQKYSSFMHDSSLSEIELSKKYGYRLWGDFEKEGSDLSQRVNFLKEFTRRIETSNLIAAGRLYDKLKERGAEALDSEYSSKYFSKAATHFYNYREGVSILSNSKEVLNSERKEMWKRIHAVR